MPEPNLLPLNLSCLSMSPSDYRMRIPILPDTKRNVLMEKYGLTLEIAMQIVVSYLQFGICKERRTSCLFADSSFFFYT